MYLLNFVFLFSLALASQTAEAKQKWCRQTDAFQLQPQGDTAENPDGLIKKMDIIWVIDDSSSMASHQKNLRDNINHFFSILDGQSHVDFQMGIVTTGLSFVTDHHTDKPISLFSTSSDENRKEFMRKLIVGANGSSKEKGSEALLRFISKERKFVRKGSLVMINILTDEDDASEEEAVASMQKVLQYLESEGNSISVNLIALEDKIEKYNQNFSVVNTQHYPLLSDDFSKTIAAIAEKSVKSVFRNFELKFDVKTILSVKMQNKRKKNAIERYQAIDENTIGVDLGFTEITPDTRVLVEYVHACTAIDRHEVRELNKEIQDIKFEIGETIFADPEAAIESIQKVYDFLQKHQDTTINLIGAVSHSVNPISWLEKSLVDYKSVILSYRLARDRALLIKRSLEMLGIEPDRIKSKGAIPGFHRHWYSYLIDAMMIDVLPGFDLASTIEPDRRVILKVRQLHYKDRVD